MNIAANTTTSPFEAFRVRHFGLVWVSGLIWHLCRWAVAFVGTYLINDMTGSPRLVQLAGTILYAPLLLGGVAGGLMSDRLDRLTTVRFQMGFIVPATLVVGLLVRADAIEVWMLYCFMFLVGIGWVSDMTSRRALVFDLVGERLLDKAMAMEALSLSLGMVLGALVGGYAVEAVGVGASYFAIAVFAAVALLTLAPVQSPPTRTRPTSSGEPAPKSYTLGELGRHRGLLSILGVTVIANFFLFAYFPIIPVIGENLNASPFRVGLLAAGTGIGMMIGSLTMARFTPARRGALYLAGLFIAFVFLVPFALATTYWWVLASIIASGVGSGLFGSTQSTLVMAAVPESARGRALGMLSMAIGGLPLGMYVLGEVAEATSATTALLINAVVGALALATWVVVRPEVASMTDSHRPIDTARRLLRRAGDR